VKFLQWNVWCMEEPARITTTLAEIDPDIACLQEVTPELHARLSGYHCFWNDRTCGNAILSRFPIIATSLHMLQEPDPAKDPDDFSNYHRACIEATLELGARKLFVASTHLSYTHRFEDTPAKRIEADKLVSLVKDRPDNFILSGDFNALPRSYGIERILRRLKNAGPDLSEPTWTTKPFNYRGFQASAPPKWRLDYCFATADVSIRSAAIVGTPTSDHLPILVHL
jgi:endonuclease/exonuclease/phosphatase family metal-dependent hydrolase